MALISNKYYLCKFYKRIPDQLTEVQEEPIYFRAELISDMDKSLMAKIQNLLTPNVRLVIQTDSKAVFDSYEGKTTKGYVEFQGDIYQVQSITYRLTNPSSLGSGRFSKRRNDKNAIKIMVLV
jgi:hypothetical protein